MSKVLLINGSPHRDECTFTALDEIRKSLEKEGICCDIVWVGNKPVPGCTACGKCAKTGRCVFDDSVNLILEKLDDYSCIVAGSPVYYAGPSGQICCLLDRLFYASGNRMANKLGASIVSCRRGGATAAFDRLNKYFGISNMYTVGSQYWNQVHGNTPDEVREDKEGLQTMRTLALNIAWMLKSIENGKVPAPEYEKRTATNFIRKN